MLTLNAYIYKPKLEALTGVNDHIGLAGLTNRNRRSCEKI